MYMVGYSLELKQESRYCMQLKQEAGLLYPGKAGGRVTEYI